MKCRWGYVDACGEVTVRATLTVYVTDHTIREKSHREMCQGCCDYLTNKLDTIVHSIKQLPPIMLPAPLEQEQDG